MQRLVDKKIAERKRWLVVKSKPPPHTKDKSMGRGFDIQTHGEWGEQIPPQADPTNAVKRSETFGTRPSI